jgi:hypothetical protein
MSIAVTSSATRTMLTTTMKTISQQKQILDMIKILSQYLDSIWSIKPLTILIAIMMPGSAGVALERLEAQERLSGVSSLGVLRMAWERLERPGSASKGLKALGLAWERLEWLGSA